MASWALVCDVKQHQVDSLLKILRTQSGLEYLPSTCRTLVKTPRDVVLTEMFPGFYFHFGLEKGIVNALKNASLDKGEFDLYINIDGLPLSKSSGSQFWSVLLRVANLKGANEAPFNAGTYWGLEKPFDSNIYLEHSCRELKVILEYGITVRGVLLRVRNCAFICDAPAKAFILKIVDHGGYSCCPKCETIGEYAVDDKAGRTQVNPRGRVVYVETDAALRDDESFRSQSDPDHHRGRTILEELPIDLVLDVPFDYLHLTLLGVHRKLGNLWIKGGEFKLSPFKLRRVDGHLVSIKKYCPRDFARKPRITKDFARWKGTEHGQCLEYFGPVVFFNIVPQDQYEHFLSLSIAIRILSSESLCITFNEYAHKLLVNFVKNSVQLYGKSFVSYNVHGLIHLAKDVIRFGPLNTYSAYPFENYLQEVKRKVRKSEKPLKQLVHRTQELELNVISEIPVSATKWYLFKKEHFSGPTLQHCFGIQFRQVLVGKRFLSCEKTIWQTVVFY